MIGQIFAQYATEYLAKQAKGFIQKPWQAGTGSANAGDAAFQQLIPQLERLGIKVKRDRHGEGKYTLTMGTNTIEVDARRFDVYKGYQYNVKTLLANKTIEGILSPMRMYNILRKVF